MSKKSRANKALTVVPSAEIETAAPAAEVINPESVDNLPIKDDVAQAEAPLVEEVDSDELLAFIAEGLAEADLPKKPTELHIPQGTTGAGLVKLMIVKPDRTGGNGTLRAIPKKKEIVEIDNIPESVLAELAAMNLNKVWSIKTLFASGYTRAQIIAAGYNSSTVFRQVGEYVKKLKEVAAEKAEVKATATEVMANAELEMPAEDEAEEEITEQEMADSMGVEL